jgi:hypothetical protein
MLVLKDEKSFLACGLLTARQRRCLATQTGELRPHCYDMRLTVDRNSVICFAAAILALLLSTMQPMTADIFLTEQGG